ncbi:MAG: DUF523 domain-containing protein [Spirochaetaceae bacterium]|nr:DUF523 domain-containing protein [Spirochaetaceae bacterium]
MNILVSRCLLGFPCRYDGKSTYYGELIEFIERYKNKHNFIGICPEVDGGLPIPRATCEIVNGKVLTINGEDKTKEFIDGANTVVDKATEYFVQVAILKSNSPSCGTGKIYDGNFSNKIINGSGIASKMLSDFGVYVITEEELDKIDYLLSVEE